MSNECMYKIPAPNHKSIAMVSSGSKWFEVEPSHHRYPKRGNHISPSPITTMIKTLKTGQVQLIAEVGRHLLVQTIVDLSFKKIFLFAKGKRSLKNIYSWKCQNWPLRLRLETSHLSTIVFQRRVPVKGQNIYQLKAVSAVKNYHVIDSACQFMLIQIEPFLVYWSETSAEIIATQASMLQAKRWTSIEIEGTTSTQLHAELQVPHASVCKSVKNLSNSCWCQNMNFFFSAIPVANQGIHSMVAGAETA